MKLLAVLAMFCLASAEKCGWDSPDGFYDFSEIAAHGVMGPVSDPSNPTYETQLALCTDNLEYTAPSKPTCGCFAGTTCSIAGGSAMATKFSSFGGIANCLGAVGKFNAGADTEWAFINDADHSHGVIATFRNGDECFGSGGQSKAVATIRFECFKGAPGNTFTVTTSNLDCDWTYTIETELACGGDDPGQPGRPGLPGLIVGFVRSFIDLVACLVWSSQCAE